MRKDAAPSTHFTFYLGTDRVHWLRAKEIPAPLMISRRALSKVIGLRPALIPFSLDSGGFTELEIYGTWTITAREYARETLRFDEHLKRMLHAAIQDWPCTGTALRASGLTVREHQERTTASFFELTSLAPEIQWIPILVGQSAGDYLRHANQYDRCGVALASLPLVGIGGIAQRQEDEEIAEVTSELAASGVRLHAYGIKKRGIAFLKHTLASADSSAWGVSARNEYRRSHHKPPECRTSGPCNHCVHYAVSWLREINERARATRPRSYQRMLRHADEHALLKEEQPRISEIRTLFERQGIPVNEQMIKQVARQHTQLSVALALAEAQLAPLRFYKGALAATGRRTNPASPPSIREVTANLEMITSIATLLSRHGQSGLQQLARKLSQTEG